MTLMYVLKTDDQVPLTPAFRPLRRAKSPCGLPSPAGGTSVNTTQVGPLGRACGPRPFQESFFPEPRGLVTKHLPHPPTPPAPTTGRAPDQPVPSAACASKAARSPIRREQASPDLQTAPSSSPRNEDNTPPTSTGSVCNLTGPKLLFIPQPSKDRQRGCGEPCRLGEFSPVDGRSSWDLRLTCISFKAKTFSNIVQCTSQ